MTDDTDHDDHGDDGAVSLPLIDSFAALEAELDAKADRIERLEAELDRRYLDPEAEAATAEGPDDSTETASRTPGDWEPATDPLREGDAGATPSPETPGERGEADSGSEAPSTPTSPPSGADDDGLAPVRTASSTNRRPQSSREPAESEATAEQEEPTGLTMEAGSNLTGGSLGSSTDELSARMPTPQDDDAGSETTDSDADAGESAAGGAPPDPTADRGVRLSRLVPRAERRDGDAVIDAFVEGIEALDEVTRAMLAHYRAVGDAAPVDAHVAAGGSGERQYAYARNRTLRKAGVIEHGGAGRYRYALPDLVAEAFDGTADGRTVADVVAAVEEEAGLD